MIIHQYLEMVIAERSPAVRRSNEVTVAKIAYKFGQHNVLSPARNIYDRLLAERESWLNKLRDGAPQGCKVEIRPHPDQRLGDTVVFSRPNVKGYVPREWYCAGAEKLTKARNAVRELERQKVSFTSHRRCTERSANVRGRPIETRREFDADEMR